MIIYLSFFSISSFSNSVFFVIFSDKIRIQICIKHHHHSPFFNNEKRKRTVTTVLQKIFHTRPSHSLFSLYHTPIFVFPLDFAVDFFCAVYKNRNIILKERTAATQRCINPDNFCIKGLHVAKTG